MNFYWNSEGNGKGDIPMVLDQDCKEDAAKHPKKTLIIFGRCWKMYELERCHAEKLRPFY